MLQERLLGIVQNNSEADYDKIASESKDGKFLYHLSHIRSNLVEWLDIDRNHSVLEIGSETGALTGFLASRAGDVTCVEISQKNNEINRERNRDYSNISYITGKYKEAVERHIQTKLFDFVFMIAPVKENINSLNGSGQDILQFAMQQLKSDGKLVVAVDNRFGMKFFAGNRGNFKEEYFEGLEWSLAEKNTGFTKKKLEIMGRDAGADSVVMYYPYPDYRLPLAIYSDKFLPKCGELTNNYRNFECDRMYLFNESTAFDNVIREGMFSEFSNSYLAVMQKQSSDNKDKSNKEELIFVKYSNDRADEFNIRTDICNINEDGNLHRVLHKRAWNPLSEKHINNICENYLNLTDKYAKTGIAFNQCRKDDDRVVLEYLEGKTLDEVIIDAVQRKNFATARALVKRFMELVRHNSGNDIWDIDMIFKNIIAENELPDSKWTVIDYEWTFKSNEITPEFIIYRSIYYFIQDNKNAGILDLELMAMAGISREEEEKYYQWEQEFQLFVSHDHMPLGQIYPKMAGTVYNVRSLVDDYAKKQQQEQLNVYTVKKGMKQKAQFLFHRVGETFYIKLQEADVEKVMIEPCKCWSFIHINRVSQEYCIAQNGMHINNDMFAFQTLEPKLEFSPRSGTFTNGLEIDIMISNQGSGTSSTFVALLNEVGLLSAKADGIKGVAGFACKKISAILNKK